LRASIFLRAVAMSAPLVQLLEAEPHRDAGLHVSHRGRDLEAACVVIVGELVPGGEQERGALARGLVVATVGTAPPPPRPAGRQARRCQWRCQPATAASSSHTPDRTSDRCRRSFGRRGRRFGGSGRCRGDVLAPSGALERVGGAEPGVEVSRSTGTDLAVLAARGADPDAVGQPTGPCLGHKMGHGRAVRPCPVHREWHSRQSATARRAGGLMKAPRGGLEKRVSRAW
jgi:hypothetical protein